MNETTSNITAYIAAFWQSVIGDGVQQGNASLILDMLVALNDIVEQKQTDVKEIYTNPIFENLYLNGGSLKASIKDNDFYKTIKDSTLDIATLSRRFDAIELSEQATVNAFIAEVNKALDELLKNSTDPYLNGVKDSTKRTVQAIVDFIYYLNEKDQPELKEKVDALIQVIADWAAQIGRMEAQQKENFIFMLQHSEAVLSILNPFQKTAEDPQPSDRTRYEIMQQFRENLPKAEAEIRKPKSPDQQEGKALHLAELFDASVAFSEIQSYESVQVITKKIRDAVSGLFNILNKIYGDNSEAAPYLAFAKQQILHWLTLPEDFRPDNWVEVIHYIVNHIQYTLKGIRDPSFAKVNDIVLPILDKLDAIFYTINNEDFKLIITPKDDLGIWDIDLPDILDDEDEDEDEVEMPKALPSTQSLPLEPVLKSESNELNKANNEPLTYDAVIEFLCFDEQAIAKLGNENGYIEVIQDLYYGDWIDSRINKIVASITEFIEKNNPIHLLEDLKKQLLAEGGVNVGAFIDYLIDTVIDLANKLIDFIKDTINFIIDELFKLVKAVIAFFQKVDLPPFARELLKELPPFEHLPDNVTLLHVVAAIPYTLFQAFVNFEPDLEVA